MISVLHVTNFRGIIRQAYESDPPLLEKWHVVAGTGLDNCVNDTVRVLEKDTHADFQFFAISNPRALVAYFGVEADRMYLTTFFVMPEFRDENLKIWSVICDYMRPTFYAAIYSHNIPCMKFYAKVGTAVEAFQHNGKDLTLFRFEKRLVCH